MFFLVFGILQAGTQQRALRRSSSCSASAFLAGFFLYIRARERAGKEPLLSTGLFRNRTCNLALVTQNIQWLLLMGVSFVVSVFLQEVRGYSAIKTGVVFTAATVGILVSSFAAAAACEAVRAADADRRRLRRHARRDRAAARVRPRLVALVAFAPGLLLIGLGLGGMLTPSVNVVQSSFPEALQGEISGLSRSVSNLGSSFGTAIAGTILVSVVAPGTRSYAIALIVLVGFGLLGLVAALRLPAKVERASEQRRDRRERGRPEALAPAAQPPAPAPRPRPPARRTAPRTCRQASERSRRSISKNRLRLHASRLHVPASTSSLSRTNAFACSIAGYSRIRRQRRAAPRGGTAAPPARPVVRVRRDEEPHADTTPRSLLDPPDHPAVGHVRIDDVERLAARRRAARRSRR